MARNPCPSCGAEVAPEKINLAEGVALCDTCGTVSRLSEIADAGEEARDGDDSDGEPITLPAADVSLNSPPAGCAIHDRGDQIVVRASARSMGTAIGATIFATFWNGIVSVFVLIAIAGLYTNITGKPLPAWVPAPSGGSGPNGVGGGGMPLGMTLFLCVFLTPFVLVGTVMILVVAMSLFGRNEVRLRREEGAVRTAIGPLAWSRRFDASAVKRVKIGRTKWKENNRSKPVICIEADRIIRFGSSLREDRLAWMHAVLQRLLVEPARASSRSR